ncbi:hypothetical protein [Protofrankia symbiont of Coriaria ruscifolia]|uniref:hypothetical protein n=1 Tax=Protofrankia symbiont of Coriaria ruscifolia TaxID=1306542 RepID=UPI001A941E16|nr:hypothetical protein [Protofrankia symbiont of Coriaria ruscifolia]
MGLGEAWWFFDRVPERGVEHMLELLDGQGLHLRHPADELIYVFDEIGSRREASLSFVAAEWTAQHVLTMQLWVDADTDVVVAVESGGTCVTFSIDGLLRQEAERVIAGLALCACVVPETRALVVDRYLPEGGDAWRHGIESRPIAPPSDPDLLVGPEEDGVSLIRVGRGSWLRRPAP